jgi:gluconolactonase
VRYGRSLLDVEVVVDGLAFPEGPVELSDGSLLVAELAAGRLTTIDPATGRRSAVIDCGGGPNGAAVGPDGAVYVCNNGGLDVDRRQPGRIQRVDLCDGAVEDLYITCAGRPLVAPNDLVFDSTGGFWFTDYGAAGRRTARRGAVYYARADGSMIGEAIRPLDTPNGIGLAPAGDVLYVAETLGARVLRRRIKAPGELAPSAGVEVASVLRGEPIDPWTVLGRLPGFAQLDSLAVEADGSVCVGTLLDGGITRFPADGGTVEHLGLPPGFEDALVTNLCFAGPDRSTAYVTSSQRGRLLRCRWPRPGLPLAFPS